MNLNKYYRRAPVFRKASKEEQRGSCQLGATERLVIGLFAREMAGVC
jgi:hypothetical protein